MLRQEFVVAGFVPSTISGGKIGSLALGYYRAGKLIYAGRVGTGFTHKVAGDLFWQLDPTVIAKCPFAQKLPAREARGVRFVSPELVGEIEFALGLRRGTCAIRPLTGLREDKPAGGVEQEIPKARRAVDIAARQRTK